MEDILSTVTQAEKQAYSIIEDAKKQAEQIISNANENVKKQKSEIYSQGDKFIAKAIEEKRVLAQYEADKINEDCEKNINIMSKTAESNMKKAVSYILQQI